MAGRTATQNGDWNDNATWGGASFPTSSDSVGLGTFHVTANVVSACQNLSGGPSSELILTKNNFTSAGTMALADVAVTTGPDMAGVTLQAGLIDIGASGSLTLSDDLAIVGNFELGGGTLDMNSKDMTANGNIVYSSGTLSNAGRITQDGTSDLNWGTLANLFDYAIAADATITLITAATTSARSFTSAAGSSLSPTTDQKFQVRTPMGAGWWVQAGSVSCEVRVWSANSAPGGDIILTDANLRFDADGIFTATMDGNINLGTGTLSVLGAGAGKTQTIEMEANALTCVLALLGRASGTADGKLDLGTGTHSIGEIKGFHADNADNTLALGTCTILNMTTGIVGVNLDTVTATVAHLHGDGTSTITDVDISAGGTIICHNFNQAGSTGNSGDIIFASRVPGAIVPSGILQHTRHQNRRRSRRMA